MEEETIDVGFCHVSLHSQSRANDPAKAVRKGFECALIRPELRLAPTCSETTPTSSTELIIAVKLLCYCFAFANTILVI